MNKISNTAEQFSLQVECAKKAGIYDNMFLAYGSLLGAVRSGGIIEHDDDMDVGFIGAPQSGVEDYVGYLSAAGLGRYRWLNHRYAEKFVWCSIRMHPAESKRPWLLLV